MPKTTFRRVHPLTDPEKFFQRCVLHAVSAGPPAPRVLDFGAGRGECDLGLGDLAHVTGCDIDRAVLKNPHVDERVVVERDRLPFPDNTFDVVMARYVFEHLDDPDATAGEIRRVLKPGGSLVLLTPNGWGYVALAARMVPNGLHRAVLRWIQPHRESEDVFPTRYRLNRPCDIAARFPDATIALMSGPSQYHFGLAPLKVLFGLLHRMLPRTLQTAMVVVVRR